MGLFGKKKKMKKQSTSKSSRATAAPKKVKEESKQKSNKTSTNVVVEETSTKPKSRKDALRERWATNRSEKIPIGRSFQTRDEYIEGGIAKEGADEKSFYRRVFAVETNELDELAVIKSTTSEKGKVIPDYDGKSRTRPYVYTIDDEGQPIKKGKKYVENPPGKDITPEAAGKLLKESIKHPDSYKNVVEMKKRKKDKRQE